MSLLTALTKSAGKLSDDLIEGGAKAASKVVANSSDDVARSLSKEQAEFFKDSLVRDESGKLKKLYHGSPKGEFSVFSKELASPESDWGRGFYFTDNEDDVVKNYFGGGPDFDNKVSRLAEQYENDLDIPYEEAEKKARKELYKGPYKIDAYSNIKEPAIVGKTTLFDGDEYPVKALEDYDNIEDYYSDLIYELTDDVLADTNIDYDYADKIRGLLYDSYYNGGVGMQELKDKLNELYIEDFDGNLVSNDVARSIIENLGFDGIIDPTVSSKFNMEISPNTTHYIAFDPNQIKHVSNKKPTANPNIFLGLGGLLGGGALINSLLSNKEEEG